MRNGSAEPSAPCWERPFDQPGDLAVVLRVLYLIYTAGHAGRVDLASEAIRLARQLTLATEEPEAAGFSRSCSSATLASQRGSTQRVALLRSTDRTAPLWDSRDIAEGVRVLQSAAAE